MNESGNRKSSSRKQSVSCSNAIDWTMLVSLFILVTGGIIASALGQKDVALVLLGIGGIGGGTYGIGERKNRNG